MDKDNTLNNIGLILLTVQPRRKKVGWRQRIAILVVCVLVRVENDVLIVGSNRTCWSSCPLQITFIGSAVEI